MKTKILNATLPQALENAMLTVEFLRGSLKYANPVESILIEDILDEAIGLSNRIEELNMAIREDYDAAR